MAGAGLYGAGQGLALPTLVAAVVGSSRIPPQEAGAASGVFTMVQQVAFALGVAVIMGLFFTVLGAGPTGGLRAGLGRRAGVQRRADAVTCVLALAPAAARAAWPERGPLE